MSKVLHILSSMDPAGGGVAEAVKLMTIGLFNENINSDIVTLDDPNSLYLKKLDLPIICLGPGKTSWKYSKNIDEWLIKNLQNYSIILVHGLWQYHTFSAYKASLKLKVKVPIYVYPHGMLDPYFQKAKGRKFKAIRNILFWHLFEKKLINSSNGLIFTSEEEKKMAQNTFSNYHPQKTIISSLGILVPNFKEFPKEKETNYWLYLGRIHPKKGLDMLINAYLHLLKLHNFPKLIIAGPGWDSAYGMHLKNKIGSDNGIETLGMIEGANKWNLLKNAELFILPSHQENFGISVVEALACGVVPLVTDKVNIYREIEDANAGIISEDNELSIKGKLESWFLMNYHSKKIMKENAKCLFQNKYSLKNATENLLNKLDMYAS